MHAITLKTTSAPVARTEEGKDSIMKLTDEIVKALQGCIEEGFESVSDFAKFANVSGNTISKYLRRETDSIK